MTRAPRRDSVGSPCGRAVAGRATLRSPSGQAAVELVAVLPLILAVGLAAAAIVAGHSAGEQAGMAAQAGAMALLHDGDPRAAARRALPAGVRDRTRIEVEGRRVTVRVRPGFPVAALAAALTVEVSAHAGPAPAP